MVYFSLKSGPLIATTGDEHGMVAKTSEIWIFIASGRGHGMVMVMVMVTDLPL
jgi:succinylglutamate desuccinylase